MTTRSVMLALTTGCVVALAAMASAQAQYSRQASFPLPLAGPPQLVTNGPQQSIGDFANWSPQRNVAESTRYDRLLQISVAFRQARERKECGPIGDPQLRQQCLASFQQYEPATVGWATPSHYRRYSAAHE